MARPLLPLGPVQLVPLLSLQEFLPFCFFLGVKTGELAVPFLNSYSSSSPVFMMVLFFSPHSQISTDYLLHHSSSSYLKITISGTVMQVEDAMDL